MRDLLNLLDTVLNKNPTILYEGVGKLSAGEIGKYEDRFNKFIEYITTGKPFTTNKNTQIVIDPKETRNFLNLRKSGQFTGQLKAIATMADGSPLPPEYADGKIPLSHLVKTGDFGGAGLEVGQAASEGGKEGLLVKPTDIKIVDQDIPSSDFFSIIYNNPVLRSTDYGQVVTQFAQYITAGEALQFPEEYLDKSKEKVRKAIVDYAGEYLGVLALLYGQSTFTKRAEFEQWMGGSIGDFTLFFPSKANTNIADSYAKITNSKTAHSLNISSKGTGGGASPAISGLKISDDIKKNPNLRTAVEFIELCQKSDTSRGPTTVVQAFEAMDLIFKNNPSSIKKKFHKFLPFDVKNPRLVERADESRLTGAPLPKVYHPMFDDIRAKSENATDGGLLIYAVKKEVARAVNESDAIPEFQDTILQVLEMNFIQQYADYKGGEVTFETQWPAKLNGKISVENKSSAGDPTAGGFSFKLGRETNRDNDGVARDTADPSKLSVDDLDQVGREPRLTGPGARASRNTQAPKTDIDTLGREKKR